MYYKTLFVPAVSKQITTWFIVHANAWLVSAKMFNYSHNYAYVTFIMCMHRKIHTICARTNAWYETTNASLILTKFSNSEFRKGLHTTLIFARIHA